MLTREILKENIIRLKENISLAANVIGKTAEDISIVAAIKNQPVITISLLRELGIDKVGENRVQEMTSRYNPEYGLDWHFIGQLQSNKVKYIINKVSLIHSLDRLSLAEQIDKESIKNNIITNVLIEVNTAEELSKGGIMLNEVEDFVKRVKDLRGIRIQGLMSVMPMLINEDKSEYYYHSMKDLYDTISEIEGVEAKYLSMGMSNDYELAIKCGANMIRPGRILFGERRY